MNFLKCCFQSTLIASTLVSSVYAVAIESTSFEEPPVYPSTYYIDLGDPAYDHQLADNPNEPVVNWTKTGSEMGFSSEYVNTRGDVGLTDGDYVGATDWTGDVTAYPTGSNGFELSDCDGLMRVSFGPVALSGYSTAGVTLQVFVNETGWETGTAQDSIRIWVEVDGGAQIDLLRTGTDDIDNLGIEDQWMLLSQDLSPYTTATLHVELDANAAAEAIYIDDVTFAGTPEAAAVPASSGLIISICLLAMAGIGLAMFLRKNGDHTTIA